MNNIKFYTINRWCLFILLISGVNFTACKKESSEVVKQISIFDNYLEVDLKKTKIKENENIIVYELLSADLKKMYLNLDLNNETANLEIENKTIPTTFNFTYDVTVENAVNEIKLLVNKNGELIFLFPTATEEYLTFEILKYDKQPYNSYFYFATHEDIRNIYLNSKCELQEKNNSYVLTIGSFKFKGDFLPQTEISKKSISQDKNLVDFKGLYNICIPNKREDSIKSETCYEIIVKSNIASIDTNTLRCKGDYTLKQIKNDEIDLVNHDTECILKIKRSGNDYLINIDDSSDWLPIKKE